jgi:hypothetical protein
MDTFSGKWKLENAEVVPGTLWKHRRSREEIHSLLTSAIHAALPRRYLSNSRLGGPQSWFGHFGEKNLMSYRPTNTLVTLSTALSWLPKENVQKL